MEKWVPIKGFEGRYEISSLGNLRSVPPMSKKIRMRKTFLDKDGYVGCSLRGDGKYYTKKIHRLVAEAFIPNSENKPEINHINGDKADNRVDNLEWATRREQNLHKIRVLEHYTGPIPPRKILCIETGVIYPSVRSAAEFVGIKGETNISHAAKNNHQSGGYHWKYVV